MAIEVGSAFVSIIPSFKGFGRELARQLSAETAGVGAAAGQTISKDIGKSLKDAGDKTADFGQKLNRNVTLPIAGAGGLAFKAFADFDQTMRQVGVQTNLSGAQLKEFTDLALKMGADTSFSANDASKAMLELAKGGLTSAQIKGGALAETLTLAAAGGIGLDDAASTLANTMNTFGIGADKANVVSAALAGAANASTASVDSLRQALAQVGPGAKLVGVSLNDTVATLAAFDNAGVKGSDAGTSLKTMLQRLTPQTDAAAYEMERLGIAGFSSQKAIAYLRDKGIKPLGSDQKTLSTQLLNYVAGLKGVKPNSDAAQKAFQKLAHSNDILGTSFFDATGKAKPMSEIAQTLQDSLKGLTKEQQQTALTTIFGADAYRAAAILAQNGSKGIGTLSKATTNLSAAQKMAKTNTEGAKGTIEQLKGSVETAAIQIGTTLAPTIVELAKSLTNLVNKFGQLSPATQKTIITVAALAAGFGPVVKATGNTITALGKTVDAAKATADGLKKASTGIRAFGAGLANGQSGLSAFASPAQRFGSFLNRVFAPAFSAIKGPILAAAGAMRAFAVAILTNPIGIAVTALVALVGIGVLLYKKWAPFRAFIDNLWAGIQKLGVIVGNFFVQAWQKVVAVAQSVWATLQRLWSQFTAGMAIIGRVMGAIFNVITQPLQGIIQIVTGFFNIFVGLFTGNFARVGEGVANVIAGIVRFFVGMPMRIYQAVAPLLPAIGSFFANVFSTVWALVTSGIANTVSFFASLPGRALRAIVSLAGFLYNAGRNALAFLYRSFVNGVATVINFFRTLPAKTIAAIASLAGLLLNKGKAALTSMGQGIANGAVAVFNFFRDLPGRIVSGLGNIGSTLLSAGGDIIRGFIQGIQNKAGDLINAIRSAITDKLPAFVKSALGIASPSKVFAQIGRWVVEGLRKGILTNASKALDAARRLAIAITDATNYALKRAKTPAERSALIAQRDAALKAVRDTMKRLTPLLKARDGLNAQIKTVTAQVASLKAAREKVRSSLADALSKGNDLFQGALDGVLPDPQSIANRLAANLAAIKRFGDMLKSLTAKGFGTGIVAQIAAQGVEGGQRLAEVLSRSTPAQVKAINASFGQISEAAADTATSVAHSMYDAGVHAAEGLLAGLKKKKTQLEAAMVSLSDALVKAIQKRLQIKSPSRVFAGIGDNIGAGLEVGINGRRDSVHAALDSLARVPNPRSLAASPGGSSAAYSPNVRVFIGDRELTHIVRTEVDAQQGDMALQLAYGRRV